MHLRRVYVFMKYFFVFFFLTRIVHNNKEQVRNRFNAFLMSWHGNKFPSILSRLLTLLITLSLVFMIIYALCTCCKWNYQCNVNNTLNILRAGIFILRQIVYTFLNYVFDYYKLYSNSHQRTRKTYYIRLWAPRTNFLRTHFELIF